MEQVIHIAYFLTAFLFIIGLKRMSSPVTARSGIIWAGWAMLLAVVVTFFWPGLHNYSLMIIAVVVGSIIAWVAAKKVAMTDMPQMIAIYNGMGGGAAAAIAALELFRGTLPNIGLVILAIVGGLIGSIAFSGSVIAFGKLQGLIRDRPITFPLQKILNLIIFVAAVGCGGALLSAHIPWMLPLFFVASLLFGVMMTLPIGGGDMPVVISLYNALTGLAVGFEGFAMENAAMIIAGTVVGAAGTLLTLMMARAMNRSLKNILFGAFGKEEIGSERCAMGSLKPIELDDAAILLAYADKVVIVPGYGMAVAQAQHKVRELMDVLDKRGVTVKFAVHPVAGRMPGHMNVLLAEAGVPYEKLFDLEEINPEFPNTNVSLVIGANDVVNPAARTNTSSPIYGMPILDVDRSTNVLVIKRGKGKGFAGVENELFFDDNTRMLYGDAQDIANKLVQSLKKL
ncbi:MAG: NAD(P) transhydrogenase subunit beta [Deltaproteobacteria bacterium RIFCSPLOWO2_01_44_7]|nr:MAG: NAD(P) transhydrogenase subunit beta [Deltaproteobacteria bacterium RIFCSPHIGHO2_01_FULL_43_49]OGQ16703.1 MAG: NAD(P) transhydrogenase subunit beta [Deltaproteobacteria bacterium RIFCSPHIGHO2_02_FULL_44_53]OGQ29841.1 MAG: NAD(P) transhydrogenase subunit beta [Deltaproteobacteria bacterium RIFCSPHIGHO2_12_FULL_44_21]OGQ33131.1 MAG: NAD(P) transhydrogenase subunit beta [Deltaproteobacteria bacterium RIFCSPLOWO2_01_FULL_45_74]OGQ38579.1 MAG: NAD(P) transhydrogenase subunit beta [Deltaprote